MKTAHVEQVDQLLDALTALDRRTSKRDWIESRSARKQEESCFHDRDRDPSRKTAEAIDSHADYSNRKFYKAASGAREYTQRWIQSNVPGKVFLDFACGSGESAIRAAEAGAALAVGIDLSYVSIDLARENARKAGVQDRTFFLVSDCEDTGLPDACIDVALANGVLHHMDLSFAFPELRRILKTGGRLHASEALSCNPVIQLYRRMTPHLRTEWEKNHILSLKSIDFAEHFFEVRDIRYWHLFSVVTTLLHRTPLFKPALALGNAVDAIVLKAPPISWMAWVFTFELVKTDRGL